MTIQLPPLPYEKNALMPYISENTINYHYGKHHQTYVNNLNNLIKDTELSSKSLEDIIKISANDSNKVAIFNNSAQIWNHTFYWNSMKPNGGGSPDANLLAKLNLISDLTKILLTNLKILQYHNSALAGLG